MTTSSNAAAARPAATILLLRDQPSFEVLMVERHHQIDFASGALVFPGGKWHDGDHDPAWAEHLIGGGADYDSDQRALRIAAIREVFEEAGVLLARKDGEILCGEAAPMEVRQAVDRGELPFLEVVKGLGAKLDLDSLTVFARWITPAIMPKRFDTWFYIAEAPADQLAACDGRETVDATWIAPSEALRKAETGERKIIFPTRMNVQLLAEATSAADAVARARARTLVTVEPKVEDRPEGRVLTLPPDAGYGTVAEPLSSVM
ncbi:MAG: NUDIX hydrolase [Phenylobacterium sp.]|uniref:NUDIX hydrolase n=1 Tax=Phenylobacterium sp. TaxID=1871053 RepID=UPI00391D71A5